jgi:hypothetical protein
VETSTSLEEHFMTINGDLKTINEVIDAEIDALPDGLLSKYTGTTQGDRANYLFENADTLAAQAVAAAREKIGGRNLAVEADAYANQRALERANQLITDPDSVMDAARPERNDTTSKENAKRVGQEILGARHVHEFLSDSEGSFEGISPGCLMTDNRLAELQGAQILFDTAPEVAAYLANLQRADEMAATREERVGAIVDEAFPTEEELEECARVRQEYFEMLEDPITISRKRFDELIAAETELNALEEAGVDNWEGYSYAMETLEEN